MKIIIITYIIRIKIYKILYRYAFNEIKYIDYEYIFERCTHSEIRGKFNFTDIFYLYNL